MLCIGVGVSVIVIECYYVGCIDIVVIFFGCFENCGIMFSGLMGEWLKIFCDSFECLGFDELCV